VGIREDLLPVVNDLRGLPSDMGLSHRRFAVTIRRRVWSGPQQGEGQATDYNIVIAPIPRVRDATAANLSPSEAEWLAANRGSVAGQLYRVDKITPRFTNADNSVGGYLAEQLRLWPNRDTGAVENLVALVGDDGYLRECEQVTFDQDRAFGYSMLLKEIDRPRTALIALAVTPATPTIPRGTTQAMVATGTFNGGATSILSVLSSWQSSNQTIATVDIYGVVTPIAVGAATISANALGISGSTVITVS
jgi:hypothetical protein